MNQTKCVNINVKNIRPEYNNLKEWMEDSNNVYIGRKEVVFIDGKKFPEEDSIWHNPFRVTKLNNREFIVNEYRKYIVDYIKSNDLYDKSIIVGIDYGPMLFGLYQTTLVDFKKYANNWYQYALLKRNNGIDFSTLELDLFKQLENIKYLFITDYSFDYNQEKIKKFINNDKWEIIGKIEKTNNFSDFYILKKLY